MQLKRQFWSNKVSQRTETICDQCGARKGETNHWFFAEFAERSFTVYANSTRVPAMVIIA
jgi:hypothetical protein